MAWCSADGSSRLSFCLYNHMGKSEGQKDPQALCLWVWDSPTPTEDSIVPKLQRYLLKLLFSLVKPGMAGPAFLLGHFHDLLERGIVLACVAAQEDIQAGQWLLFLLFSSVSCSGVAGGGNIRIIHGVNHTWQSGEISISRLGIRPHYSKVEFSSVRQLPMRAESRHFFLPLLTTQTTLQLPLFIYQTTSVICM